MNNNKDTAIKSREQLEGHSKPTTKEAAYRTNKPRTNSHQEPKAIKHIPKLIVKTIIEGKRGQTMRACAMNSWLSHREVEGKSLRIDKVNYLQEEADKATLLEEARQAREQADQIARYKASRLLLEV